MAKRRSNDKTRVIEINAVLDHLQQVKEDTTKMIMLLNRERSQKQASIRKAHKRR